MKSVRAGSIQAYMRPTVRELAARLRRFLSRPPVMELVVIIAVVWVAHFYHFRSLGLYEDDYTHTSPALGWQLPDISIIMVQKTEETRDKKCAL